MVWLVLSLRYGRPTRVLSAHPLPALKSLHQGSSDLVRSMASGSEAPNRASGLRTCLTRWMGRSAAAASRFRGQSPLDVLVDRFDRDPSGLAFLITVQLTRVDEIVQLLARDLDGPHGLIRRCYERRFQRDGI